MLRKKWNPNPALKLYLKSLIITKIHFCYSYGSNTSGGGGSGLIKEHSDPSGKVATA